MLLNKDTRFHIEVAILTCLGARYPKGKEATSKGILAELLKRRDRVALDLRQIAAIYTSRAL